LSDADNVAMRDVLRGGYLSWLAVQTETTPRSTGFQTLVWGPEETCFTIESRSIRVC
jgi:hypothetical protein